MLQWYQNLPQHINPVVFSVGPIGVRWYALMYLLAFLTVYWLMNSELKKNGENKNKYINRISRETISGFILWAILGLMIGARMGFVIFYDWQYFSDNPLAIIWPYDFFSRSYIGISGMSYFGGLIGSVISGMAYLNRKKIDVWKFSEWLMPAIPAGYFFGRIGNFLNGELFGRKTEVFWGIYFPNGGAGVLRHPSQLYEAFFEGLALFLILLFFKKKSPFPGFLFLVYLWGYGIIRFSLEFLREPDPGSALILNTFTNNQIFSLLMVIVAFFLWLYLRKKRWYNLNDK
jgi:phosphatidylglycerol:prolipoprotein diacylglycerol transferase